MSLHVPTIFLYEVPQCFEQINAQIMYISEIQIGNSQLLFSLKFNWIKINHSKIRIQAGSKL